MTHSVPSGNAVAFHTPQGVVLHSGDFKLDTTPVDGRLSDLARIGALAAGEGIRLLLADSTNADEPGWAVSESKVGGALYDLFHEHAGRRIVTVCFSSHIHRIQQIADAAIEQGRVVATLGLSMRKNVRLARSMGLLDIPDAPPGRHRGDRRPRPRPGVRDLHRLTGRALLGAGADGVQPEPLHQARPRRHGDPRRRTRSRATRRTSAG